MWYYHKVEFKREILTRNGLTREYLRIYHIESETVLASFPSGMKKNSFGSAFRNAIKYLPKIQRKLEEQDKLNWVATKN